MREEKFFLMKLDVSLKIMKFFKISFILLLSLFIIVDRGEGEAGDHDQDDSDDYDDDYDEDYDDDYDYNYVPEDLNSSLLSIPVRILNAFPTRERAVLSVVFSEDSVVGVRYGEVVVKELMLRPKENIITSFETTTEESLAEKYRSTYTSMKEVGEGQEAVIIVRRHKNESMQPDSDIKLFPKRLSTNTTSKLYIHNALKNSKHPLAGLNFYAMDKETGALMVLAENLFLGEGIDVSLVPNTELRIKGLYSVVDSAQRFVKTRSVVNLEKLQALPGRRQYLVAVGEHGWKKSIAKAILLEPQAPARELILVQTSSGCSLTKCRGIVAPAASLTSIATILIAYTAL